MTSFHNRRNIRLALALILLIFCMAGLAFASVRLYRIFCSATGAYGTTGEAEAVPNNTIERSMTVHFNADAQPGLPWTFTAQRTPVTVQLGAPGHAVYHVKNNGTHPITGMARYNVIPQTMGAYFEKVQCFCFEPHTLQPGQEEDLPVEFFIDPSLDQDRNLKDVEDITLSYTFYEYKSAK